MIHINVWYAKVTQKKQEIKYNNKIIYYIIYSSKERMINNKQESL